MDSEYSFTGFVTDQNDKPIDGVNVLTENARIVSATDLTGHFLIDHLSSSTSRLILQKEGYLPAVLSLHDGACAHVTLHQNPKTKP